MDTTEQIRKMLKTSGLTQYAVAKDAGIDQAQVNRFVNRHVQGLTVRTADRLLDAMGYKLKIVRKRKGSR